MGGMVVDNFLSMKFNQALNFKRKREENHILLIDYRKDSQSDIYVFEKKRKITKEPGNGDNPNFYMAEEAGLYIPHPQP